MGVVVVGAVFGAAQRTQAEPQVGMRVYVDPNTGKFVDPPPASGAAAQPRSVRAAEPAIQIAPGTTAAGGVIVQIPASLASETRVVVKPDRRVESRCRQRSQAVQ
jgi:hypothetical protein